MMDGWNGTTQSGRDQNGLDVNRPTTDVTIELCDFKHGHGVSIGSEMSGGISNVTIRHSRLTATQRGIRIKTARTR
jgi:exo-poly-alpha-galacturonosidase